MEEEKAEPKNPSSLTRRHTVAATTIPTTLNLPSRAPHHTTSLPPPHTNGAVSSSFPPPPLDFSFLSSSSLAYTSLKDLLPPSAASLNSPTASSAASGSSAYEISIRNRLVKQAAWAYLQPMSSSPDSSGPGFFRRVCLRLRTFLNPFSYCLRFVILEVIPSVAGALDRILRAIRLRINRYYTYL